MKNSKFFFLPIVFAFIQACNVDIEEIPTYSSYNKLNAVIEIPAGSNKKIEYNKQNNKFEINLKNDKHRIIQFLPYPLNYGFIASTLMDKSRGGDGDPIDVIVIAESVNIGTVMEVIPIGLLEMKDRSELDHKVLAIPADKALRTIDAENYLELSDNYAPIKSLLELWFLNYDPDDPKEIIGWKDEKAALLEINKWTLKKEVK